MHNFFFFFFFLSRLFFFQIYFEIGALLKMDPVVKLHAAVNRLLAATASKDIESEKEVLLSDLSENLMRLNLKTRHAALQESAARLIPELAELASKPGCRGAYTMIWEAIQKVYETRKKSDKNISFYVLTVESNETFIVMCDHIAHGNNGTVHEAFRLDPPSKVAVKEMRITEGGLKQASRELTVQRDLWHPNVVRFLCAAKPELDPLLKKSIFRFVMEFCPYNLSNVLGTPLDPNRAYELLQRLLFGYQALAARHVIHRDIKPENVLFSDNSFHEPKLADFGAARQLDERDLASTFQGTPYYMAPEVLRREAYDSKCDVWSFGMLFYHMIFGKLPFIAKDILELLRLIQFQPMFPNGAFLTLPEHVREILVNTLQFDPSSRWNVETLSSKTGAAERYAIACRVGVEHERMYTWDQIGLISSAECHAGKPDEVLNSSNSEKRFLEADVDSTSRSLKHVNLN
jgi:serine/threonine protein kinase